MNKDAKCIICNGLKLVEVHNLSRQSSKTLYLSRACQLNQYEMITKVWCGGCGLYYHKDSVSCKE